MKLPFTKQNSGSGAGQRYLRPSIFDVQSRWFLALGTCALVLIVTALIGAKIFYDGYFENYKSDQLQNNEPLINEGGLSGAIKARNKFLTASSTLPRDPSI